jgi:hypothetical protein
MRKQTRGARIANYFAMNGLYSGPPEVMGLARKRENILPAEEAE